MLINKEEIAHVIPHTDNMCLLDGVLSHSTEKILCFSHTHRHPKNPMRSNGILHALCGIEYAAQAMAIHGAWGANYDHKPRLGYLAALRDIHCTRTRLDDLTGDLIIEAEKMMGDDARVIYSFNINADSELILSGRATVVLDMDKTS